MAAVITLGTKYGKKVFQINKIVLASLAGDSSYPTGGYPVGTLLDVKDKLPGHTIVHVIGQEDGNYRYSFDQANGKLKFLNADTGAEIADTTDVSAATAVPLIIFCQ